MIRPFRKLLLTILLIPASLAWAQSEGVLTVETSSAGSTQIRYFIASTYCPLGAPQTTQVTAVPGGWQITTSLLSTPCFGISPPGGPATLLVNLGYLRQGQYTVTWSFTGGIGYGTRLATFTIAQDQVPLAVPTLTPFTLVVLSLAIGAAVVGVFMRRQQRNPHDA